jgi:hypothetical protein
MEKRVVYPGNRIGSLYSDEKFQNQSFAYHHDGFSPLSKLKLGMISQIPLDYMHLVCLGVVKKLLLTWTAGPLSSRLGPRQILDISRRLIAMKSCIPVEFNRKCRSLRDLKHWKATEFRMFVLFVGPVALCKILNDKLFKHFLLLHSAIFILCSKLARDSNWVLYAGELLNQFVAEISDHYYKEFYMFNVHSLLHLHLDVLNLGPLDMFSAFEFENSMQYLKKMLRTNRSHLSQVVRRVYENNGHTHGSSKRVVSRFNCNLSEKNGNNCFITREGNVFRISACQFTFYECHEFLSKVPFLGYPCESSKFGIYVVSKPSRCVKIKKTDEFKKCMLLPYDDVLVCIPIINS